MPWAPSDAVDSVLEVEKTEVPRAGLQQEGGRKLGARQYLVTYLLASRLKTLRRP
jgi:hypothetical protein